MAVIEEISRRSRTLFFRDSEKVYVLRQTYRLVKATAAVVRDVAGQVCRMLPEGSVVVVESDSDTGRRVNIRCEHQEFWMFTVDLDARGSLVREAGEMPLELLKPPMPLRAGVELR